MASIPSSYIVTVAAVDARTRDQASFAFLARPQAMTAYVRFVEGGTITMAVATKVLFVGASAGTGAFFSIDTSGTFYRVRHSNGTTTATSTLAAAPTYLQRVELRAVLNADGSVLIGQSINEAAETLTTTSSAVVLAQAWGGLFVWFNSNGTSSVGLNAFRNVEVQAGVHTMQEMRVRAGTD